MIKLKYCHINLHNFLLTYEIKQIKEKIGNIEKNLLPLLFNGENNDINFIDFNNSINDLKNYLVKYNITQNEYKIDLYFSFITLVAILLVVILCYKIYNEFRLAFYKKIK